MEILNGLQSIGLGFIALTKDLFLSENSRLWWAWLLITFPLIGALVGVFELKRTQTPITFRNLFQFVFPSSIYKSASFRNDVIIVSTLYVFYAVIIFLFVSLEAKVIIGKMIAYMNSGVLEQINFAEYKKSWTKNLGVHLFFTFVAIVLYDFGFTMLHYAFHRIPFLWKFHKVHHSAEVLTPLTVARFHIVEFTLQKVSEGLCLGLIFGLFYYLLPQGVDLYKVFGLSLFGILFSAIGVFRHSHIWISYGFMNYVFCSPAMHQIHHSTEERDWNEGSIQKHLGVHFRNK